MNNEVGSDTGCFDMAPYDTRCALFPRRRAISVVSLPPVKGSGSYIHCSHDVIGSYQRSSCPDVYPVRCLRAITLRRVVSYYLTARPLLDFMTQILII